MQAVDGATSGSTLEREAMQSAHTEVLGEYQFADVLGVVLLSVAVRVDPQLSVGVQSDEPVHLSP